MSRLVYMHDARCVVEMSVSRSCDEEVLCPQVQAQTSTNVKV